MKPPSTGSPSASRAAEGYLFSRPVPATELTALLSAPLQA